MEMTNNQIELMISRVNGPAAELDNKILTDILSSALKSLIGCFAPTNAIEAHGYVVKRYDAQNTKYGV